MRSRPGSTVLLIDRHEEGARVTRFILDAETSLVVLHGAPDSGKTELITRWVIPELRVALGDTGRRVLHGECGPLFPATFDDTNGSEPFEGVLRKQNILIVDDFGRVFDLPRDEQRAELDRVFALLLSSDAKAVVVLVTASRQLNSIYALAAYDQRATSAVCELRAMTVEEALSSLGSAQPDEHIEYMPAMLKAVSDDCATLSASGWADTFDLVKLVHTRYLKLRRESGVSTVDLQDYQHMGGARGILRAHLEQHLETLDAEHHGDADIARTILERLLDAETTRSVADLSDVGPRLGTSSTEVDRVIARLAEPDGLLRQKPGGVLRAVPPQLLVVIDEDFATRKHQMERAQRIVAEGVSIWLQIGSLLPRQRFEEAHAERRFLSPDEEQARFLLHCALLHERDMTAGAALYWLRRIGDREEGLNVLLISLVHPTADARRRAAALLGEYDQPEVRHRLRSVAVADSDPQVRSQAVDSLARMKTDDVMKALLQEVSASGNPYRGAAVEALRIFPCAEIASVLQQLVNDRAVELPLRETATRVLATLNIPESVDALLDIALNDVDDEDRRAAAKALASTRSEDLNRRIFLRLGTTPRWWIWVARIVLGFIALALAMVGILWLGAVADNDNSLAMVAYLVISLIAVVPTGMLMVRLRDQRIQLKSPLGGLAVMLFALNTITIFPIFHGVAHFAVKMRSRAAVLFGVELLGIVFFATNARILEGSTGFAWVVRFYQVTGIALFFGSYLYDVVGVLLGSVLLSRATMLEERRTEIYKQVFTNSDAAKLVFDSLDGDRATAIPSARRLLRKFGRRAPSEQLVTLLASGDPESRALASRALRKSKGHDTVRQLESLWGSADESLRRRIASVLFREPNERSLEALNRMHPRMSLVQTLGAGAARWRYRFAVWPWPVWAAVVALLPTFIPLVYDGLKVRSNPAWSQIVALRQAPEAHQKAGIVRFLADEYPSESGPELFEIFKKDRENFTDPVHGAIARALVRIDTFPAVKNQGEWHRELMRAVSGYAVLLASDTSTANDTTDSPIKLALEVLESMAAANDRVVANTASQSLVRFVGSEASKSGEDPWPRKRAIAALGTLPYRRGLPLLDTLFSQQRSDRFPVVSANIAEDLRLELNRVSRQAYTASLAPDSADVRRQLLLTLLGLTNQPEDIVSNLSRRVKVDSAAARNCDFNADGVCDAKDKTLRYIANDPADEYGYREMFNHYIDTKAYLAADSALDWLKQKYPDEVWPRKILSENRHEYLSLKSSTYFMESYDEMGKLRALKSYTALPWNDRRRIEIDYVEVALSARSYDETDSLALAGARRTRAVRGAADPLLATRRLNYALFAYIASVMKRDRAMAEDRLTQLDSVVRTLPSDFANKRSYPGTDIFITRSNLPAALKQSLRKLCKAGKWYSQTEAAQVIAENRKALELLRQP